MYVISVLNQKGGAGKTTIAMHLARALQLDGDEVLLIDSDPQGSARDWAAVRDDFPVPVVGVDRPTLDRDIKKLNREGFVIIDGAPRVEELAVSAIKASDLVLIAVQPSALDIWASNAVVDFVRQRMELTDGKLKAAMVISRAVKGTRLDAEVEGILAELGLPVFESRVMQRTAFARAPGMGTTVLDEDPGGDESSMIRALAMEVRKLINSSEGASQ